MPPDDPNPYERYDIDPLGGPAAITERMRELAEDATDEAERKAIRAAWEELTLHLVNYNRTEPAKKRSPGAGIHEEKPIAVGGVRADLALPAGFRVGAVEVLTPEADGPAPLRAEVRDGRLSFTVPEFLVYAVVRIRPA